MMRRPIVLLVALLVCPVGVSAAPKGHQPRWYKPEAAITGDKAPASTEKYTRCTSLEADYEDASKHLALNAAEDISDNGAIRSASRHAEDQTTISKADMTMKLMAANRCKMPTSAPDARRYLSPALTCQTDIYRMALTGGTSAPASCDMSAWTPSQS